MKLDELGRPKFRISCRDADWLGANDWKHLRRVSPDDTVRVFRLDPLNDEGISQIVGSHLQSSPPEEFVNKAVQSGVQGLLENPQSLLLLLRANSSGVLPKSRTETFQRACESLSQETNDEHLKASPNRPGTSSLLELAGELCTILILTGREGCSDGPSEDDRRIVALSDAIPDNQEAARFVLRSRLFKSTPSDVAVPVHRYVAEFLAGRHLAGRARKGTPAKRILALLTGYDGFVVSEFQGLSAWFAAHSKASRSLIIDRDPVGTLLYGDVSRFSCEEKKRLIQVVAEHLEGHAGFDELLLEGSSGMAGLATPDMADPLLAVLRHPDRGRAAPQAMILALRAAQAASCEPRFSEAALEILENEDNGPLVRDEAFEAFAKHAKHSEQLALLDRVWKGMIADPDDQLLGHLLSCLYPKILGPAQVVPYVRRPKSKLLGSYQRFWQSRIRDEADLPRIAELLDALAANRTAFRQEFDERHYPGASPLGHMPARLLARYLHSGVDPAGPARIFGWLELVSDDRISRPRADDTTTIREWFASRPDLVKLVFRMVVERTARERNRGHCIDRAQRLMLATPLPSGFENWCDESGRQATDEHVALVFLNSAQTLRARRESGALAEGAPPPQESLEEAMERLLVEGAPAEQPLPAPSGPADPEKLEWRSRVRGMEDLLQQNRCPPAFLEGLARAYFGNLHVAVGTSPQGRLYDLLGEQRLVDAALAGLRDSVKREDMPTYRKILELHSKDRGHRLALPVMAGMEEIDCGPAWLRETVGEELLRAVLAFQFTTRSNHLAPDGADTAADGGARFPRWYRGLVESDPELVADMLIRAVQSEIPKGFVLFDRLLDLLQEESHAEIARRVSLDILNLIPVRCNRAQLDGLEVALKSALKHCEQSALAAVIEARLGRKSMTDGQRVYWLAAGLFVDSSQYRPKLEQFILLNDQRIGHLVEFLGGNPFHTQQLGESLSFESLDVRSLESLIVRCGKLHRPVAQHTRAINASARIESLVRQLGNDPSADATDALQRLVLVPYLNAWRYFILHWQRQQLQVRRNASHAYASAEQVHQTLANASPANATDLSAVTVGCLQELASQVRDGNTSGWRQFWNWGPTPTARWEDLCRDHLLDLVGPRLKQLGVDALAEVRYADDKRADIRVWSGESNVPVEIKRSTHRELWSAVRNQLIAKYVRDPGTNGHGIYLVLWFGAQGTPMPPHGARPESAQELQQRLQDSLTAREKLKISIIVIDVSEPASQ